MCGDVCGSAKTYREQVCMPLNGKVHCIDKCIHYIIASLIAGGVSTATCCCGHGKQLGSIVLSDGRWFAIVENKDEWIIANEAVIKYRKKKKVKSKKKNV